MTAKRKKKRCRVVHTVKKGRIGHKLKCKRRAKRKTKRNPELIGVANNPLRGTKTSKKLRRKMKALKKQVTKLSRRIKGCKSKRKGRKAKRKNPSWALHRSRKGTFSRKGRVVAKGKNGRRRKSRR